eukprot:961031-Rhodomonas_salina.1
MRLGADRAYFVARAGRQPHAEVVMRDVMDWTKMGSLSPHRLFHLVPCGFLAKGVLFTPSEHQFSFPRPHFRSQFNVHGYVSISVFPPFNLKPSTR